MTCNNKHCLYFSIKRLVFQVVFDRQRNGTASISKDTMISALFFRNNPLSFGNKILREKLFEREISDSRKEFQILVKVYKKWSVIRTTFQGLVCSAVVEIAITNYDRTDDFIWTIAKAYNLKQIGNFFFQKS